MLIDECNGDNFDYSGLGFIGVVRIGRRPVEQHMVPEGIPKWEGLEKALADSCLSSTSVSRRGAVMAHRENYLDLDPTCRDVYCRPLMSHTSTSRT
jgi:gluconate 2-dehydrogenase alpha chain